MRALLGGKGANLAEMTNLGCPTLLGLRSRLSLHAVLRRRTPDHDEIKAQILNISASSNPDGKELGDSENPLLVSVRSGARASIPGMMDTILNLGLNDEVVEGLAKLTNNERFAYDSTAVSSRCMPTSSRRSRRAV
jgi:pyruvate,orthophosphate dikinase